MIKRIITALLLFVSALAGAQENEPGPQMADAFRENGKIYVVIAVIGIVFVSLLLFLVYIERKLKKMENKLNTDK